MQMTSQNVKLLERNEALKKYNTWEKKHRSSLTPQAALAGIIMLYELIPMESRRRPVNPQGIKAMHQAFARMKCR